MVYFALSMCGFSPGLIYSPYADSKFLFAHVSLLHAADSQPVSMIEKGGATLNPLHGGLFAFCCRILRPTVEDPNVYETVGAFVFPDLSVRHEGLYRLLFHVYEVLEGEVILRGVCISNTFRVYAAKEFPGMADSTPFTELLKNHGLRVRVGKSSHSKRRAQYLRERGKAPMGRGDQVRYDATDSEYHEQDVDQSERDSTLEWEDPDESMVN